MVANGFKKVYQEGGTFVVATFFNPDTKEYFTKCVRDYDYSDCSRDDDEAYYMPIDEDAVKAWHRFNGIINVGDEIKVVKGRKVKVGTIATVEKITEWKDTYGRVQTIYAHLSTGERTSIFNCELV